MIRKLGLTVALTVTLLGVLVENGAACCRKKKSCSSSAAKPAEPKKADPAKKAAAPLPATIVVFLPEDARLSVNGYQTTSTSGRRVLAVPPIDPDQEYHPYVLKAEVMRDGRVVTLTKEVEVTAGTETHVRLELPAVTLAAR